MNKYMARADFAFRTFFLDAKQVLETDEKAVLYVMENHPKSIARMQMVSKIVSRGSVESFYYEQRIPLSKQYVHQLAGKDDGDEKFSTASTSSKYPDGSIHMHVELHAVAVDSYSPQELQSIPHVASAIPGQDATLMETESAVGGVTILRNVYVPSVVRNRSVKRTCTAPTATAPSAPHDDTRREAQSVLQLAEAQQQQALHQQQQQAKVDYEEDEDGWGDSSVLSATAESGLSEAVDQASSLQQSAAKGGLSF